MSYAATWLIEELQATVSSLEDNQAPAPQLERQIEELQATVSNLEAQLASAPQLSLDVGVMVGGTAAKLKNASKKGFVKREDAPPPTSISAEDVIGALHTQTDPLPGKELIRDLSK